MRWIKELFNPTLKCQRLGHQHSTETIDGFSRPPIDDRRNVVVKAKKIPDSCRRCGIIHSTEIEKSWKGFNSVSWPSYMWDELEKEGFVR